MQMYADETKYAVCIHLNFCRSSLPAKVVVCLDGFHLGFVLLTRSTLKVPCQDWGLTFAKYSL